MDSRLVVPDLLGDQFVQRVPFVGAWRNRARRVSLDGELRATVSRIDRRVHAECEELAGDDHELIDGNNGASNTFGGTLCQEHRDSCGRAANCQTQNQAENVHDPHVGREGVAQRADNEQDRQHDDVVAATEFIRQASTDQSAKCGSDGQDTANGSFFKRRQFQAASSGGHVHVRQST